MGTIQVGPAHAAARQCLLEGEWASSLSVSNLTIPPISSQPDCLEPGDWGSIEEASLTPPTSNPQAIEEAAPAVAAPQAPVPSMTMGRFLDRVMHAESGGKLNAKNSKSTALGPFQFINSTFLALVKRHFSDEVAGMSTSKILALRTNLAFSRRAVEAFTRENAAYLLARGVEVTFPALRLAHLLGPAGAVQALKASQDTPLTSIFSSGVMRANPFMTRLNVAGLIRRAERELGLTSSEKVPSAAVLPIARIALRTDDTEARDRTTEVKPQAERAAAKPKVATPRVASKARGAKRHAQSASSRSRTAALKSKGSKNRGNIASLGKRKMRVAGS